VISTHIPPTIKMFLSPAAARDLELFVREVADEAVRIRVDEAAVSPYMTPAQAAQWLGCHRRRIDDLCRQGRLQRHHEGRRLLLSRAEVEALVSRDGRDDW
jgi:excisionase family DNA binding protein